MELVEVVASDEVDPEVLEAQQRFIALEFPAQFGSKVMKHLSTSFQPLTELGFAHLKRLKKHPEAPKTLVALVCPLNSNELETATHPEELQQLEKLFDAKLTTAEALKLAPRTRELFEKHTKQWPLIFHASVEEAASLPPIEEEEKQKMKKHLREAVAISKQVKGETKSKWSCAWGCVVVDPVTDEQVATSEVVNVQSKYNFKTIYHPVMVAVDGVAERDRRREEADEETTHKKQKRLEGEDAATSDLKENESGSEKKSESYLCTGYDIYLDREPCAMCAMALVHSRARRAVFDRTNPGDGVLLSSFKLHTIKSLNHHYRVFHSPLTSEE